MPKFKKKHILDYCFIYRRRGSGLYQDRLCSQAAENLNIFYFSVPARQEISLPAQWLPPYWSGSREPTCSRNYLQSFWYFVHNPQLTWIFPTFISVLSRHSLRY